MYLKIFCDLIFSFRVALHLSLQFFCQCAVKSTQRIFAHPVVSVNMFCPYCIRDKKLASLLRNSMSSHIGEAPLQQQFTPRDISEAIRHEAIVQRTLQATKQTRNRRGGCIMALRNSVPVYNCLHPKMYSLGLRKRTDQAKTTRICDVKYVETLVDGCSRSRSKGYVWTRSCCKIRYS